MKTDKQENVAAEMAELCLQRLEEAKNKPALIPGRDIDAGQLIARAKLLVRGNFRWLTDPDRRAQRIALGMFIAVALALLGDGGGTDPDGQWKSGGHY